MSPCVLNTIAHDDDGWLHDVYRHLSARVGAWGGQATAGSQAGASQVADSQSYIFAKAMRRRMTPPEARFWSAVRGDRLAGTKWRRQHPVGPYILDFYCAAAALAVEIDGAGHDTPDQMRHDERRTRWLAERGVRVIRIAAEDVRIELDGVLEFVLRVVRERTATA